MVMSNKESKSGGMETVLKGPGQEPQGAAATKGAEQSADDLKKSVQTCTSPSGVDKDGKPDQSLSEKQVERAATETLHAIRPQPVATSVAAVLEKLAEKDEAGQPKQKFKTSDEVISAAQAALKELEAPAA